MRWLREIFALASPSFLAVFTGFWLRSLLADGFTPEAKTIGAFFGLVVFSSSALLFTESRVPAKYLQVITKRSWLAGRASIVVAISYGMAILLQQLGLVGSFSRISAVISIVSAIVFAFALPKIGSYLFLAYQFLREIPGYYRRSNFHAKVKQIGEAFEHLFNSRKLNRFLHFFVPLVPALVTIVLVYGLMKVDLFQILARQPNDEIEYYMQIVAFAEHGFNTGYFIVNEEPASAGFTPFGPHGPMYTILYGSIARLAGAWQPYSASIVNLILISLGLAFFCWAIRPNGKQLIVIGLLFSTFWYGALHWASNMQEGFHHFIAIMLAGFFFALIRRGAPISRLETSLVIGFLFVACLTRFTWGILFPLVFFLRIKRFTLFSMALAFIQGAACILVAYLAFQFVAAPYPDTVDGRFLGLLAQGDLAAILDFLRNTLRGNLAELANGFSFVQFVVAVSGLVALTALWRVLSLLRNAHPESSEPNRRQWLFAFLHVLNLGSMFFATMMFYNPGLEGTRTLAAHLLLSLLMLVASRQLRLPIAVFLVSLLVVNSFALIYRSFSARRYSSEMRVAVQTFEGAVAPFVAFDPQEKNRWCNTMLVSIFAYDSQLTGVDPGIGLSSLFPNTTVPVELPFKTKYVLFAPYDEEMYLAQVNFELLTETSLGNLYYNVDSGCSR